MNDKKCVSMSKILEIASVMICKMRSDITAGRSLSLIKSTAQLAVFMDLADSHVFVYENADGGRVSFVKCKKNWDNILSPVQTDRIKVQ